MSDPQRPEDLSGAQGAPRDSIGEVPHEAPAFGYDSDPAPEPYLIPSQAAAAGTSAGNPYQPSPYGQPDPYSAHPSDQAGPSTSATGFPYSGAYAPATAPRPSGRAIAALVCGCVAVVLAVIPILDIFAAVAGVAGIVLGAIALRTRDPGRGLAIGGLIVSSIGAFLSILFAILFSVLLFGGITSGGGDTDPFSDPFTDPVDEEIVDPQIVTASDPGSSLGTLDSPAPIGTTVQLLSDGTAVWEVTLGPPTLDAAIEVAAADPSNHPAAPGNQYAMVPITIVNVGPVAGDPYWDLYIDFVGSDGVTYYEFDDVAPDGLVELEELKPGESGTGNVVVEVPASAVDGGMWAISYDFSDDYHFAAE